jgi:hypothetical protein
MPRPPGSKNKPKIGDDGQPIPKKDPIRISEAQQERLEEESDMLFIPPELVPEGMRYNWKTLSVFGQQQSRRFGRFQATGWEPVPASRHPGLFTPKDYDGFIEYDGLVLMEKPEELCLRSEARDFMKARDQVQTKEQQLRGGNLAGVSLDAQHKSAVRSNKINKSYERFEVPE